MSNQCYLVLLELGDDFMFNAVEVAGLHHGVLLLLVLELEEKQLEGPHEFKIGLFLGNRHQFPLSVLQSDFLVLNLF
jgi:hypothetical protein